jgi:hypothetical protein
MVTSRTLRYNRIRRHMAARVWLGAGILFVTACSSPQTSAPTPVTPAASTTPAPLPLMTIPGYDQNWQLTTVITGNTGTICGGNSLPVGQTTTGQMVATRADTAVKFLYWAHNYQTDDMDYTGVVQGNDFVAQSDMFRVGPIDCPATLQARGENSAHRRGPSRRHRPTRARECVRLD